MATFEDLMRKAAEKRRKLTGVGLDPYAFAEASAAGAPGRLESARTQKLAEAKVTTGAEQFEQSLAQTKLHFTESLTEQKRASAAMEAENAAARREQEKAAKKAEIQGYVGMGLQAPLAYYAGKQLFGGAPTTAPALTGGASLTGALGVGAAGLPTLGGGATALTGTLAAPGAFPTLTGASPLYVGGPTGAAAAAAPAATAPAAALGLGPAALAGIPGGYLGGELGQALGEELGIGGEAEQRIVGGAVGGAGAALAAGALLGAPAGPAGIAIGAGVGALVNVIGGGTVLCTELHRQGLLPDDIYEADSEYGRQIDPIIIEGYHSWGIPFARIMRKSRIATSIAKPFIKMWAYHMAYKMGVVEKDNLGGRILEFIGVPLCKWIGSFKALDVSDTAFP